MITSNMPYFVGSTYLAFIAVVATLSSNTVHGFIPNTGAMFTTRLSVAAEPEVEKPLGAHFLPEETIERAKNGNAIEKIKLEKDGCAAFVDVYDYARKIREGEMTWEEVEKADLDTRLKYVGMLHRGKRTPGQFMMRLRVPNGIIKSDHLRFYADCKYKHKPKECSW